MSGGGHVWQRGACVAGGACVVKGGMHGEGVHGKGGACVVKEACVAEGGVHGMHAPCPSMRYVSCTYFTILIIKNSPTLKTEQINFD